MTLKPPNTTSFNWFVGENPLALTLSKQQTERGNTVYSIRVKNAVVGFRSTEPGEVAARMKALAEALYDLADDLEKVEQEQE